MSELGSKEISAAAVRLAISQSREEEKKLQKEFLLGGIKTVGVDFGGEFSDAVTKIIERATVAAKREGVIGQSHSEEGAVMGAAHEAVAQIINKAIGLNLGGKIGIARAGDHISVCVFFAIGLLNLNDVAIGLGHRAI
ncbi:MAG: HutP family protein [Clostridia bacterium]|nr:HutP family protein [Clostridia bacterium]